MIEKKIYSSYAFTENESEKGKQNRAIHKELTEKYKVYRNDCQYSLTDGEDCNFNDYDIVIGRKPGYAHAEYCIYKNAPALTTAELALLCDHGNLCFGYSIIVTSKEITRIRVSED